MAPNLEELRSEYEDSLFSVAQSMRTAAQAAEAFAKAIGSAPAINGHHKGKGKEEEEETMINGKRKRVKKDPNAPKRPASSFIIFQNDIRQSVKVDHPDLPTAELRKLMAEKWSTLPEEQKNHYKKLADDLKVNYTQEKAAYNARSPEEVAAADAAAAAVAAVAATKKQRKPRKSVAATAPAPIATKKPAVVASVSPVSGSDDSEVESSEDEKAKVTAKPKSSKAAPASVPKTAPSSSDDEEEEEEEEESDDEEQQPPPKKSRHNEKPVSKRK